MKKIIFTLALTLSLSAQMVYSQEFSRRLNVFSDFSSGDLTPTPDGFLNGNEYLLGIGYSQNFEQAPWLTFMLSGAVKSTAEMNYTDSENKKGKPIIGMKVAPKVFNGWDFLIGLNFGGWAEVLFLESYDFVVNAFYNLPLPAADHRLLFKAGVETYVFGWDAEANENFTAYQRRFYLDVFQLIANYNIRFHPNWFYETEIIFKFKGTPILDTKGRTANVVAAHDTAEAFRQNFHIVYGNMIGYNHSSGLNLYAKLEYEIRDILKKYSDGSKYETVHDLQFKGGISYSFDFSKIGRDN